MEYQVIIVATPNQLAEARAVRYHVFVREQGIPLSEEQDGLDKVAVHCVAYLGKRAVGAGRMILNQGVGKIGRMAVLTDHRNAGLGGKILAALEAEGLRQGATKFELSAQNRARPFYIRAGYREVGEPYDEVGIVHVHMEKSV